MIRIELGPASPVDRTTLLDLLQRIDAGGGAAVNG